MFIVESLYLIFAPQATSSDENIGILMLLMGMTILFGSVAFFLWILSLIRNRLLKGLLITSGVITGLFPLLIILQTYIFGYAQIEGSTMRDYKDQNYYWICRVCKDFKRQDVIIHRSAQNPDVELIGRVIGFPNETIEIEKNVVKINGQTLNEPYADWSEWSYDAKDSITLGDGDYLTLVDRRMLPSEGILLAIRYFKLEDYRGKIFK